MAIELIKESFKVEELKGGSQTQALVETDLYISPTKPAIEKILWVQAKADVLNTKIIRDKLIVSGLVKFNVLYKSVEEENNIETMETTKDFREEIEIPGVNEDMTSKTKAKTEHVEWDLEESKLTINAVVGLQAEVEEYKVIESIKDVDADDSYQVLQEQINYKEIQGNDVSYAVVKEILKLDSIYPEIDEIVKINIKTKEVESMAVEDRIITSGEALVNIIYAGEDELHSFNDTVAFNHFVEMPGASKDQKCKVEYEVSEGAYEVLEDDESERRLIDLEIKVKVSGKVYEEKTRDLIVDIYSTRENILIERQELNLKESIKDVEHTEELNLNIGEVDAKEILDVDGEVEVLEKSFDGESIVVDGVISLDIHYIDRVSEELASYSDNYPFRSTVFESLGHEALVDVDAKINKLDYVPKKENLGLDMDVLLDINLSNDRKIYAVKEIKPTNTTIDKKNKPSITIYIVQKNDNLWDIAKRYNTTKEEILTSNNLSSDEIVPGMKIIIEKMVEDVVQ